MTTSTFNQSKSQQVILGASFSFKPHVQSSRKFANSIITEMASWTLRIWVFFHRVESLPGSGCPRGDFISKPRIIQVRSCDWFSPMGLRVSDLCLGPGRNVCVLSMLSFSICWMKKILQRILRSWGWQSHRQKDPGFLSHHLQDSPLALLEYLFGLYVKSHQAFGVNSCNSWHCLDW